ncbi:hypothetical protein LAZ40_02170 [Cereibacter sphaeroides]|uniref:hypothetical protein n=1 Tax=Cereibacter sphaeroides TaxID=1063 RepID=UPI001F485370|nr:hypothetical protein [Cereibacter sphaeroides]MCE6957863.1 hypothetical protein [Cereibacter sphaeroides]MCE6971832.1 hypothetical protein [Cereibacter sphaeroides]
MAELRHRLDRSVPGDMSPTDKLRHVFRLSREDGVTPSRQKLNDMLAGRRPVPAEARATLRELEARAELQDALSEAWSRFRASVFWSVSREFVLEPAHAMAVADELRHGSLDAFRQGARIRRLHEALVKAKEGERDAVA